MCVDLVPTIFINLLWQDLWDLEQDKLGTGEKLLLVEWKFYNLNMELDVT
jgi:hypothetical protein